MFVLKFKIGEKKYLLHDGKNFVGGNSYAIAESASLRNAAAAISVGGFDIVETDIEGLAKMIGTTVENASYNIVGIHGGLIPFDAVEIVNDSP